MRLSSRLSLHILPVPTWSEMAMTVGCPLVVFFWLSPEWRPYLPTWVLSAEGLSTLPCLKIRKTNKALGPFEFLGAASRTLAFCLGFVSQLVSPLCGLIVADWLNLLVYRTSCLHQQNP
jgi:hypothetical protein